MSDDKPTKREPHRWQAGMPSPNPKGRPRVSVSLAAAVRQAWPPDRIVALATELAEHPDAAIRLRALEWLSDRAHGRAPVTIDATISPGIGLDAQRVLARLSTDALRELVAASEDEQLEAVEIHALDADDVIDVSATELPATTADREHQTPKPSVTDEPED